MPLHFLRFCLAHGKSVGMIESAQQTPPISQMPSGCFWVRDDTLFTAAEARAYRAGALPKVRADEITDQIVRARDSLAGIEVDHVKWFHPWKRNLL